METSRCDFHCMVGCIGSLFTAEIKCRTRSCLVEKGFVWPHSWRDAVHDGGEGMAAEDRGSCSHCMCSREAEADGKWGQSTKTSRPIPSRLLLPERLYLFKVLQLSKIVPPAGDSVFKPKSPWGHLALKP